jgi:transcriptional regulator with AAA-type ATPase domain
VRELENTIQRACALSNSDVLLPSDIPLGSNTQRVATPIHTLTRMQDALQTLLQGAQNIPDFELLSWTDKELKKMALRLCQQDQVKAAQLLGISPNGIKPEPKPEAKIEPKAEAKADSKSEPKSKARKVS